MCLGWVKSIRIMTPVTRIGVTVITMMRDKIIWPIPRLISRKRRENRFCHTTMIWTSKSITYTILTQISKTSTLTH